MANTNAAATILNSSAPIIVKRGEQSLSLSQGDSVFETDIIQTQDASVELLFADGAKAFLSPGSTLTLQEFSYNTAGESSFVVNLATGAMRSISGKIVEQNPDVFKILTPKATAGIRGTDFGNAINPDGTESVILFAIDQGHNLVITTHTGNQISLTTARQGVHIGNDELSTTTQYDFTEEEIYNFMGHIFDSTDREYIEEEHKKILEEKEEPDYIEENTDQVTLFLEHAQTVALGSGNSTLFEHTAGELSTAPFIDNDLNFGTKSDIYLKARAPLSPSKPTVGGDDTADNVINTGTDNTNNNIEPISGAASYYADAEFFNTPGVTHNLINHTFTIDGDIGDNIVISGDAGEITEGTVNAGHDIITGSNITSGRIVGDANTVGANAMVSFGNDRITVDSKTGGTSIYGDAHTIETGATVSFGHDTITVNAELANTAIAGDVFDNQGATVTQWGNDNISVDNMNASTVNGTAYHAIIYGDSQSTTDGGNDIITISGTMQADAGSTSTINAGGANDTIHVGTLGANATINGDDGDDSVSVNNFAGGSIDGGAGTDRFVWNATVGAGATQTINDLTTNGNITGIEQFAFQSLANGTIEGTVNADQIFVYNTNGGAVNTGSGADTTTFTHTVGGNISVSNSADADHLYLNNGIANGASVTLEGIGDFTVKQDATTNLSLNSGTLYLNNATNSITLESMSGSAALNTADGANVTISTLQGGAIHGGSAVTTTTIVNAYSGNATMTSESNAQHSVILTGGMDGGSLTIHALNASTGGFAVGAAGAGGFDMNNGTLYGSSANDAFTIGTMYSGEIIGDTTTSGSNDTFTVTSMNGGILYGDSLNSSVGGNDTFNIAELNNSAQIIAGAGADSIDVSTLSGNIDGGIGIDEITITTMTGGNINGGAETDNITINNAVAGAVTFSNNDAAIDNLTLTNGITTGGNVTLSGTGTFNLNSSFDIADGGTLTLNNATTSVNLDTLAGSLNTGTNADTITVTEFAGGASGTLSTGTGSDTITITTFTNGTIDTDAGNDDIRVNALGGGTINAGSGINTIRVTANVNANSTTLSTNTVGGTDIYEFTSLSAGQLNGTTSIDHIYVKSMTDGHINGGGNADSISVGFNTNGIHKGFGMSGGTIDGGGGNDDIKVVVAGAGAGATSTINVSTGNDVIDIYAGAIDGSITIDSFNVATDIFKFEGSQAYTASTDVMTSTGQMTFGAAVAAGQTIELTGMNSSTVNVTFKNAVTSIAGNQNHWLDAEEISSTINTVAHNVSITGNINNDISGDIKVAKTGSYTQTFANDTISGTTLNGGKIYGDAETIEENVSTIFGNDTITISYMQSNDGEIYGDAKQLNDDAGNTTFGGDTIKITGTMTNGKIYGDAISVGENITVTQFGNDNIEITAMQNGEIYGDASEVKTPASVTAWGQDTITITGTMSGGRIDGDNYDDARNGAADTITVNTLNGGEIYGGGGTDEINITNMGGGYIAAGEGADTITATITNTGASNNSTIDLTDTDNAIDSITLGQVSQSGTKLTVIGFEAGDVITYDGADITSFITGSEYTTNDGNLTIYFT